MSNRLREVVGKHSTWYVCDLHGWDFTNEDKDVCPVCLGESLERERIIKKLIEHEVIRVDALGDTVFVNCYTLHVEYLRDALTKGEEDAR